MTGTVIVKTAGRMFLLSVGIGSVSEFCVDVGVDVMLRGGGIFVGLVRCSFWLHHVSDEVQWRRLCDTVYDNVADSGKCRGLSVLQDHMVSLPHWTSLIMVIACDMLKLYMHAYDY